MSYNNYPGDFNQGGYNSGPPGGFNQGGYNSGPPSNFGGSSESFDEIDFDSINPNAEPWEIAKNLTGGERDLSFSSNDLQNAFNKAQHMNVDIDTNRSRDMFDQANVTARGGGGTSMTTKLIAGAAGFAAMNYYQNYQKKQGKTVHYAFLKKMVAGVAMAQAVKMFNKNTQGGSGFMGMGGKRDIEASREAVAAEAAANAMKLVDEQYGDQQGGYGGNQQGGYGGNQQGGYGGNQQGGYGGNQQGGYGGNQYGSGPNVPQGPGSYNPPNQGGGYGGNQGGYGQPPSYSSGPQGGSFGGDYKDPQGGYGGNQGGYGGNQGGYGGNQGNQGGYGGNQGYPPQPGFPGQGNPPSNNPPGPGGFIDPSQRRY